MDRAYAVFTQLEAELGRPVTYVEVLAIAASHEFGWGLKDNQEEYDAALEAMGRQFYNFCTSGTCHGDQLWKFLGSQQAWYAANATTFAQELRNGSIATINFSGARRILNQPSYNPDTATPQEMKSNWRSGNGQGNVPFKYGNYSMFRQYGIFPETLAQRGPLPLNGTALNTSYLNRPDANLPTSDNGYLVLTMGQYYCLIGTGPCE